GENSAVDASRRNVARPAHDAWLAQAAFVGGALALPQRPRRSPCNLAIVPFAQHILVVAPRTVVARENHQRVVAQTELVVDCKQSSGVEIDFLDRITIETSLRFAAKLG